MISLDALKPAGVTIDDGTFAVMVALQSQLAREGVQTAQDALAECERRGWVELHDGGAQLAFTLAGKEAALEYYDGLIREMVTAAPNN